MLEEPAGEINEQNVVKRENIRAKHSGFNLSSITTNKSHTKIGVC